MAKRMDPCDYEPFTCPYNAFGYNDCRNYCGVGCDGEYNEYESIIAEMEAEVELGRRLPDPGDYDPSVDEE